MKVNNLFERTYKVILTKIPESILNWRGTISIDISQIIYKNYINWLFWPLSSRTGSNWPKQNMYFMFWPNIMFSRKHSTQVHRIRILKLYHYLLIASSKISQLWHPISRLRLLKVSLQIFIVLKIRLNVSNHELL